jgi:hypothetical protein
VRPFISAGHDVLEQNEIFRSAAQLPQTARSDPQQQSASAVTANGSMRKPTDINPPPGRAMAIDLKPQSTIDSGRRPTDGLTAAIKQSKRGVPRTQPMALTPSWVLTQTGTRTGGRTTEVSHFR